VAALAEAEGLVHHAESVRLRGVWRDEPGKRGEPGERGARGGR
jgi:hypothetical protein